MRASLFITCYNDTLFPETGRAVVACLERLGVELDFHPQQTCCGQMHANTGFRSEAFSQAKRFVRLYQDAENVVDPFLLLRGHDTRSVSRLVRGTRKRGTPQAV